MDLYKALQILNLQENYTEEQLKKSYRKLIIKYHPDKNPENKKEFAEKQTKIINEAKDILEKHLKGKKANNNYNHHQKHNQSNEQLNQIKILLLKIEKEIIIETQEILNINLNDKLFKLHKNKLLNILQETQTRIQYQKNITTIEKEYQSFKELYREELMEYCFTFSKSSNITLYDIEYYHTLKEIRNYMKICIHEDLESELYKYSNHKYYKELMPLLTEWQTTYMLSCLYGYGKIETIQEIFNIKIDQELKKYEKRKRILEELEMNTSFVSINVKTLINLRENLLSEENFYKIYSQINTFTKIKSKIKKLFQNK